MIEGGRWSIHRSMMKCHDAPLVARVPHLICHEPSHGHPMDVLKMHRSNTVPGGRSCSIPKATARAMLINTQQGICKSYGTHNFIAECLGISCHFCNQPETVSDRLVESLSWNNMDYKCARGSATEGVQILDKHLSEVQAGSR